jgi:tetratricopeptide (TPR) repeat protein
MRKNRANFLRRRVNGERLGICPRGVSVVAVGVVSAFLLSACGSPSASQTVAQNLTAGVAAQNVGNYASAINYYKKVLASQPKNPTALYDIGDVDQLQNLNAAAMTNYKAALAIDPNFISAMYNLATLEASSTPNDARVLYQQVIKLSPKNANAHFNLGYVLLSLGKQKAGLAQINQGIKLNPSLKSRVAITTTTVPAG